MCSPARWVMVWWLVSATNVVAFVVVVPSDDSRAIRVTHNLFAVSVLTLWLVGWCVTAASIHSQVIEEVLHFVNVGIMAILKLN